MQKVTRFNTTKEEYLDVAVAWTNINLVLLLRPKQELQSTPEFQSQLHCLRTIKHLLAPTNEYKNKNWQSIDAFVLRHQPSFSTKVVI
jgi:hypothetical protein